MLNLRCVPGAFELQRWVRNSSRTHTLRCSFGPISCFGLIRGNWGRLWPNLRSFLLGWATATPAMRAICNTELHYVYCDTPALHCITFDAAAEIQSPNHLGRLPKTARTPRHACFRTSENSPRHDCYCCCLAIRSTSFFSRLMPTRVPLVTRVSVALPIPIT